MPKKKNIEIKNSDLIKKPSENIRYQVVNFSKLNLHESYVSLLLGVFVVVIIAVGLFFVINGRRLQNENANKMKMQLQEQLNQQLRNNSNLIVGNSYIVKEGDDLWTISTKRYGSGFRWLDIAKTNNLENPDVLFTGTKLSLPNNLYGKKQKTYIVKEGETLWDVAVNAYGDGFRWVDIADVNNIQNPDWISSGDILILPK